MVYGHDVILLISSSSLYLSSLHLGSRSFVSLSVSVSLSLFQGGEIGINIGWTCDLDQNIEKCKPSYSFTRLDKVFETNTISKGYNFRYAKYYQDENGTEYRTLHKAFAIRFDILVTGKVSVFVFVCVPTCLPILTLVVHGVCFARGTDGFFKAGKFNTVPTLINIVAAFTSVGLVSRLCEVTAVNGLLLMKDYLFWIC